LQRRHGVGGLAKQQMLLTCDHPGVERAGLLVDAFRRVGGMQRVLYRATRIALQRSDYALGDLGIRDGKRIPTAITEVDRLR
jgi:hypothetical protein